jgi:hypothetical protein
VTRAAWRPIRGIDFGRLREARLQVHHAVQWLARAARAYVPAQSDDSHTNLGWGDDLDAFTTHGFKGDLRLRLRINELRLVLVSEIVQVSFTLDGRTDADARLRLRDLLSAHDLDPDRLDARLPYEIADHAVARGGTYKTDGLADALSELAAWYANADRSLGRVREQMVARGLAPSPVRTWPHHFDMATLILLEAGNAEHARSVNAGLSPGDEYYDEPYFYVSPYPHPDPAKLPPLPLGNWHTQGFTAAVLPASKIVQTADRQAASEAFLDAAVAAAMAAVS